MNTHADVRQSLPTQTCRRRCWRQWTSARSSGLLVLCLRQNPLLTATHFCGAGVSEEVLEAADQCAVIPMCGMVESLNVSVAAALMLNEARRGRLAALVRLHAFFSCHNMSQYLCHNTPAHDIHAL